MLSSGKVVSCTEVIRILKRIGNFHHNRSNKDREIMTKASIFFTMERVKCDVLGSHIQYAWVHPSGFRQDSGFQRILEQINLAPE